MSKHYIKETTLGKDTSNGRRYVLFGRLLSKRHDFSYEKKHIFIQICSRIFHHMIKITPIQSTTISMW